MADELKAELELARLQSMHERVERLRSQLKTIALDSESAAAGLEAQEGSSSAGNGNSVSNKY